MRKKQEEEKQRPVPGRIKKKRKADVPRAIASPVDQQSQKSKEEGAQGRATAYIPPTHSQMPSSIPNEGGVDITKALEEYLGGAEGREQGEDLSAEQPSVEKSYDAEPSIEPSIEVRAEEPESVFTAEDK